MTAFGGVAGRPRLGARPDAADLSARLAVAGRHFGLFEASAAGQCAAAGLNATLDGGGSDGKMSLLPACGQAGLATGSTLAQMNLRTCGIDAVTIAANRDHGQEFPDFKLWQMRDLDLVTGDGTLPILAMAAERCAAFTNSNVAAGLVPADFDLTTGYDLSFVSR